MKYDISYYMLFNTRSSVFKVAVLKLTCANFLKRVMKTYNSGVTMHCLAVNTDNFCCYFKQYLRLDHTT